MPESTSRPVRRAAFSLATVLEIFEREGVLDTSQVEAVRAGSKARERELKDSFRARESDDPYVSPLEIVAAFAFPSHNARRKTLDVGELSESFAFATNSRFSRIDPIKLDAAALCSIVSKPFARRHLIVPIRLEKKRLTVAMVNPYDRTAVGNIEDVTKYSIEPVLGLRVEILKTINEIFAFEHSLQKAERLRAHSRDVANLEQLVVLTTDRELDASDQHIVKAVDLLLQYAFEQRASDIHIEPKRERAIVRLRIDGRLHDTHSIPGKVYPSFLSRIKIMSRLDIAEKRRPQDGRIKSVHKETEIELRVSTVPVAFGEKVVIRIFDPAILVQDLSTMGFASEQQSVYERLLDRPHGIILVTGPTGSGKTTTLYSSLQHLSSPEVNIVTIEDPIEMVHEPFNQIAVLESAGITFSTILRNVLRQDPDIIMVGEIRDVDTARYAVQAALTGHLVFSTLHTNTAAGAITRLLDLGVEPFLISSTVIGIVSQRLLRLVCPDCDESTTLTEDEQYLMGIGDSDVDLSLLRKGRGCEKCRKTGYRGRAAAFEILELNERIRVMVRDSEGERAIIKAARRVGSEPLMNFAVRKLLAGQTTAEEILRVVPMSQ
ncbi:MAG: type II/IV secretion system protein [Candidatus Krumholzibacteriota bacterium]|nr:type II/IV secretion system protein [Candidatus Krumholzibacteriota bacterium]